MKLNNGAETKKKWFCSQKWIWCHWDYLYTIFNFSISLCLAPRILSPRFLFRKKSIHDASVHHLVLVLVFFFHHFNVSLLTHIHTNWMLPCDYTFIFSVLILKTVTNHHIYDITHLENKNQISNDQQWLTLFCYFNMNQRRAIAVVFVVCFTIVLLSWSVMC